MATRTVTGRPELDQAAAHKFATTYGTMLVTKKLLRETADPAEQKVLQNIIDVLIEDLRKWASAFLLDLGDILALELFADISK